MAWAAVGSRSDVALDGDVYVVTDDPWSAAAALGLVELDRTLETA